MDVFAIIKLGFTTRISFYNNKHAMHSFVISGVVLVLSNHPLSKIETT